MRPMSTKGIITVEVTMVTMRAQNMQHRHSEQFQWNTIATMRT